MTVEELISKWGFDINFEPVNQLSKKFDNLKADVGRIALGVTAAAGTMFGFAKVTADAADKITDTSARLGVSTQALQEFGYVAQLSGSNFDEMAGSLNFLNKNIGAATTGSKEQAKAFASVGLSVEQLKGMKAEDVIRKVADRFKGMPDGVKKSALAMDLFGKSGTTMIQMLSKGSAGINELIQEAHDLGGVFSDDELDVAGEFNDQLDRLMFAARGVRNTIGLALMPMIQNLVKTFTEFVKVNRQLITTRVQQVFAALAIYVRIAWTMAKALTTSLQGMVAIFGGLENTARLAAWAIGLFAGAKVLFGIGQMAMGLANLSKLLTLVNLKALLIPVLIGAAVVALGLVIEDIVAFFQGRDSVTGIIVEKFKEMFAFLEAGWASIPKPIRIIGSLIFSTFLIPLRLTILAVRTIAALLGNLAGGGGWSGALDVLKGAGASAFRGVVGTGTLADTLGFGDMTDTRGNISDLAGSSPGSSPATARAGMVQNNPIDAPITVNVGQGADPFAVASAVKGGVQDGMTPVMLRAAGRSFQGSGGH